MFSPFVSNELDPLRIFSDGSFHEACFWQHPLAKIARARYDELREKSQGHICSVCGNAIDKPDDYVGLGHLTDDANEPLHALNYAQYHLSCLATSPVRPRICALLAEFRNSGKWKGPGLEHFLSKYCN